jgi:hypothetical protein
MSSHTIAIVIYKIFKGAFMGDKIRKAKNIYGKAKNVYEKRNEYLYKTGQALGAIYVLKQFVKVVLNGRKK